MRRTRFYLGLAIGVLLTLFALQNLQSIHVHLFFWLVEMPLVAIIFVSAIFGALWASLWLALARWRARRRRRTDPGNMTDVPAQPASKSSAEQR